MRNQLRIEANVSRIVVADARVDRAMITSADFLAHHAPDTNDPACGDGRAWLIFQPDAATAWDTCSRGDWMIWAAKRVLTVTDRQWRSLAIAFARHVLPLWQDKYPDQAETWLAWADDPDGSGGDTARAAAREAAAEAREVGAVASAAWKAAKAAATYLAADAAGWATAAVLEQDDGAWAAERLWQADEIRRQIGNPWHLSQ